MVWSPREVRSIIRTVERTAYCPRLVETNEGEAYLKAASRSPSEGPHGLFSDWLGNFLADWLGLPTAQCAYVMFEGEACFVSKKMNGFEWTGTFEPGIKIVNEKDLVGISVLDTWILNIDRYDPRPPPAWNFGNIFLERVLRSGGTPGGAKHVGNAYRVVPIDHGNCFGRDREIGTERIPFDRLTPLVEQATRFGWFPGWTLLPSPPDRWLSRLAAFQAADVQAFLCATPAGWEVTADDCDRLASFLVRRAAFVAENYSAWTHP